MKTYHNAVPIPHDRDAREQLAACLQSLFGGCPQLIGLTFHEPAHMAGDILTPDKDEDLFLVEMGFSMPVSGGEFDDVFERVVSEIHELVADEPEVLQLLRGQTFTRTLH